MPGIRAQCRDGSLKLSAVNTFGTSNNEEGLKTELAALRSNDRIEPDCTLRNVSCDVHYSAGPVAVVEALPRSGAFPIMPE